MRKETNKPSMKVKSSSVTPIPSQGMDASEALARSGV